MSVASDRVAGEIRILPKTEIAFLHGATHTVFYQAFTFNDQCLVVQGIRPALLGISNLPLHTMGISTLPPSRRKNVAFQCFNPHIKLKFLCRRDKNNN